MRTFVWTTMKGVGIVLNYRDAEARTAVSMGSKTNPSAMEHQSSTDAPFKEKGDSDVWAGRDHQGRKGGFKSPFTSTAKNRNKDSLTPVLFWITDSIRRHQSATRMRWP